MKFRRIIVIGLFTVSAASSAEGMLRTDWLSNLRAAMGPHLCAPVSPLMKVYKEAKETCPATVAALFDKCTDQDVLRIPESITSVPQANHYGQVIAECISAYYQGGASLEAFQMIQKMSQK